MLKDRQKMRGRMYIIRLRNLRSSADDGARQAADSGGKIGAAT
jgi:hypothetical protein